MKKRNIAIYFLILLVITSTFAACASSPKSESTSEYTDDAWITTKVKSLLAEDSVLNSFKIGVETYKGIVQLSGFVDSKETIAKAGKIAKSVKGVRSVRNDLILK